MIDVAMRYKHGIEPANSGPQSLLTKIDRSIYYDAGRTELDEH